MDFLTLVGDVGFPIAGALAAGGFVFLTLKFILAGVVFNAINPWYLILSAMLILSGIGLENNLNK